MIYQSPAQTYFYQKDFVDYPLVNEHSYGKSPFTMGKPTIDGPISISMLVYQRVPAPEWLI